MLGLMILAIAFLVTVGLLNMGCVDEDLWEEVGDEVPAAWEDSLGSSKSKGKPVPPGDYFTVIKGCHPVNSLSSYPILLFVLLACSHLVMACKGCTSAYLGGIVTQGNTLAACPTTHLFQCHSNRDWLHCCASTLLLWKDMCDVSGCSARPVLVAC